MMRRLFEIGWIALLVGGCSSDAPSRGTDTSPIQDAATPLGSGGSASAGNGGAGPSAGGAAGSVSGAGGRSESTGGNGDRPGSGTGGRDPADGGSGNGGSPPGPRRDASPPDGTWVNRTGNLAGMDSECGNLSALAAKPDEDRIFAPVALHGLWETRDGATPGRAWGRPQARRRSRIAG